VLIFDKAKGSLSLGEEGICSKGASARDGIQVKYDRNPRVHIFISITEKKKLVWAPTQHFLLLPFDVKIGCLQGADRQWFLRRVQTDIKVNPLSDLNKMVTRVSWDSSSTNCSIAAQRMYF
jgi:hypothetical protein